MRVDGTQRGDAICPKVGSICLEKNVSLLMNSQNPQKAILGQIRLYCLLTLQVWTLCPVRPVHPVLRHHIWLRLMRLDTFLSNEFHPDTCN